MRSIYEISKADYGFDLVMLKARAWIIFQTALPKNRVTGITHAFQSCIGPLHQSDPFYRFRV